MSAESWWRDYDLPRSTWASWQIGPLHFHARRVSSEWQFKWHHDSDPMVSASRFNIPSAELPESIDHESARFAIRQTSASLRLGALLADRPVIARPASPLHIPPNQETILYVSTVVWLKAASEEIALVEMPVYRPSDTWFGPDTVSGELCYSSRTQARTSADTLVHLPHRAITPIIIANQASSPLKVEQLRVPVPFLSLHASRDGHLWTDRLKFTTDADSSETSLELLGGDSLPSGSRRLAEPREAAPRKSLIRAFRRFFD